MSLFDFVRVRMAQGKRYIEDLRTATPEGFRGRPVIGAASCADSCRACVDVCPTRAISPAPLALDLGRCTFCSDCIEACAEGNIQFTPDPKMAATDRAGLIVKPGDTSALRVRAADTFGKLFGRSLKLRQVSAGGCNACELELNAVANVNFDIQRFGIEWVASPRHADGLVLTGPLTRAMKDAVRLAWDAMPAPRLLIAFGACAISGGLYDAAPGVDREFLDSVGPALFVPGCPPHPITFVTAVLELLSR